MRKICFAVVILLSFVMSGCGDGTKIETVEKWTPEKAEAWYSSLPWLSGCNYTPATAINQIEAWSADTYDAALIDWNSAWPKNWDSTL